MIKASISILVALLIGLAIAVPLIQQDQNPAQGSLTALSERLDQLQQELETEIEQRKALERQIEHERAQRMALANQISELNAYNDALSATIESQGFIAPETTSNTSDYQAELDILLQAGLTQADAERIVGLETDLQKRIISSRFGSQRINPRESFLEMNRTLRSELGDEKYELYLEATGRPTSIEVGHVVPDSPGAAAGLQEGDKITSYDNERIFNINDLQQATQSGTEGQTVVMEVERNGLPVTLVLPRGTIGISAGAFDFRRGRPPVD